MQDRLNSIILQKLRVFAVVARERSFAKAADAAYLSQPTVSEEIKSLENLVGLRLINRSRGTRYVDLTEAGQILLETYDEISCSLAKAAQALDDVKKLERGTVALGADVVFGGYFIPLIHHTFGLDHPGISMRVEVDHVKLLLEGLRQGQLDLAIILGPIEQPGLIQEPLLPCYTIPVGPPGHRLAGEEPSPYRELANERLILPSRASLLRKGLDRLAAEAGTSLNIVLETGNIDAILQAVLGGFGLTVLGTPCVATELASGRLSMLRVEGFPLKIEWFMIHPDTRLTPSARALKEHLLASRELLQSKSGLSVLMPNKTDGRCDSIKKRASVM